MNIGNKKYSVIELSDTLQAPRTTINDWLTRYSQYIEYQMQGKRKVYTDASINVLKEILDMRNAGLSSFQIEEELAKKHPLHLEEMLEVKDNKENAVENAGDVASKSPDSQLIIRNSMMEMGEMIKNALLDMNSRIDELESFNSKTVQKANRWYALTFIIFIVFVLTGIFAAIKINKAIEESNRLKNEKTGILGTLDNKEKELAGKITEISTLLKDKDKLSSDLEGEKKVFEKNLQALKSNAESAKEAVQLELRNAFAKERLELLKSLDEAKKDKNDMAILVAKLQQQSYEQASAIKSFSEKEAGLEQFKKQMEAKLEEIKIPPMNPPSAPTGNNSPEINKNDGTR